MTTAATVRTRSSALQMIQVRYRNDRFDMYQTVYPIRARKLDRHDVYGRQAFKVNLNNQGLINVSCYTEYKAYGLSLIYNINIIYGMF